MLVASLVSQFTYYSARFYFMTRRITTMARHDWTRVGSVIRLLRHIDMVSAEFVTQRSTLSFLFAICIRPPISGTLLWFYLSFFLALDMVITLMVYTTCIRLLIGLTYPMLIAAGVKHASGRLFMVMLRECLSLRPPLYVRRFFIQQLTTYANNDLLAVRCGAFFTITYHSVLQLYLQCVMHFLLVVAAIGVPVSQ